ncbi:MAG: hypothetical protein GX567_13870 [Clostridia bacterium]|nr:hypothetical protein [Clostridia bacterium]
MRRADREVTDINEMEIIPTNASMAKDNGQLVSKPLEDMYPFLDREQFAKDMIIDMVNA